MQWVLQQQAHLGGQVLLLYLTARDRDEHPILDALQDTGGVVTTTERSMSRSGWAGGPVLAALPNLKSLGMLGDNRRTSALCALTWNFEAIAPWASAVGAQLRGADSDTAPAPAAGDAVLERAMISVTRRVNMNNTLKAGFEKSVVVGALQLLRDHHHVLDAGDLYAWALAHGWPARRVAELRDIVGHMNAGKNPRIPRDVHRDDSYARWKDPGDFDRA